MGRILEIDLLDDQLRLLRDDLAQFSRHEPPAAELVEEGVDGVGVREHGLAVEADALPGVDDHAHPLLEGRRGADGSEHGPGGRTNEDRRLAGRRRARDDGNFAAGHLLEDRGEILDRVAQADALLLRFQRRVDQPLGGVARSHDGGIHDDGASGVSRIRDQRDGRGDEVRRQKRGEGGGCVFHDGWVFDNSREGVWMFGVGRDRCKADADNV